MAERPIDDYPHGKSYGHLLTWHMNRGTRADGSLRKWSAQALGKAVFKLRDDASGVLRDFRGIERTEESAKKNIENWMEFDGAPPNKRFDDVAYRTIEVLLGKDPSIPRWRDDLTNARNRYYAEQKQARAESAAERAQSPARQAGRNIALLSARVTLPEPTPYFIGRDQERDQIVDLLTSPNGLAAILIQGGSGMGKTELAKAAAREKRVASQFGNRRWFVSLADAHNAEEIEDIVAESLGFGHRNGFRDALDALHENPSLLILDGLETCWEHSEQRAAIEIVIAALSEAGASLIVSIRGIADVRGVQWQYKLVIQPLKPEDAASMFALLSGNGVENDANFKELNLALGGVPLAIQLMATRANGRDSLAPLWRDWVEHGVDILCLPDEPHGALTSFVEAMRLTMESPRLTPDGRRLLSILGFLPTSMLEEDIRLMMGTSALAAEESLIRMGLVFETNNRFQLLPPIKDYVKRHIVPTDEDISLATTRYLDLIARSGIAIGMSGDMGHLRRVENDIINIEHSIFAEFKPDGSKEVWKALEGFNRFIKISYYDSKLIEQLNEKKSWPRNDFGWPYMKSMKGSAAFASGDYESAGYEFKLSSTMFKGKDEFPSPTYSAELLAKLAETEIILGKLDHVSKHLGEARDIYAKHGDRRGEGICILFESELAYKNKDFENAEHFGMFAAIYCENTDLFIRARGIKCLADGKRGLKDYEFARGLYDESQQIFRNIACDRWDAHCGFNIGELDLEENKLEDAKLRFMASASLYKLNGYEIGLGRSLVNIASVLLKLGAYLEAKGEYEHALSIFTKIRFKKYVDICNDALKSL